MITREDIRELAGFQSDGAECAISFYFQPAPPSNRSHREQAILVKDLVHQALREAEKSGRVAGKSDTGQGRLRVRQQEHLARGRSSAKVGEDPTVRQPPLSFERTGALAGATAAFMGGLCGSAPGPLL